MRCVENARRKLARRSGGPRSSPVRLRRLIRGVYPPASENEWWTRSSPVQLQRQPPSSRRRRGVVEDCARTIAIRDMQRSAGGSTARGSPRVLQKDCDGTTTSNSSTSDRVEDCEVLQSDCDDELTHFAERQYKWRVARPSGTIATPQSLAPRWLRWARHAPRRLRRDSAAPEEEPWDSWRVKPTRTIATSDAQGPRTSPPTRRGETAALQPVCDKGELRIAPKAYAWRM